MRIPVGGQSYVATSKPLSNQRCINYYFEPSPEGAKSPEALYCTPGLKPFANLGSSQIYGMHVLNGVLYAISGNNAYVINSMGGGSPLGSLGNVDGPVIMADNRIDIIALKTDGSSYLVDGTSVTQITDVDYRLASSVTVLDGFAILTVLNSDQFFISSLNDASAYNALDFATAEESSDILVRGFAHRGELFLFGGLTTEVYYNSGAGDFPFQPRSGASMSRGLGAVLSVAEADNSLFWVGENRVVYRNQGYQPERVSTFGIEKVLQDAVSISDIESFSYSQSGHEFYSMTSPSEEWTYVYDIATRRWHQRDSFERNRWRVSSYAYCYSKHLVGDFETGMIYELDPNTFTENGETIRRLFTTPPVFNNKRKMVNSRLQIDFDTGLALATGQGSNPMAMIRVSKNGGMTYGAERFVKLGRIGEYSKRAELRRLGQGEETVFEISFSDPSRANVTGIFLNEDY